VRRGAGRAIRGRGRSSPRWRPVEIEIEIEPMGSMKAEVDRIVRAQEGSGTSVARWIRDTPGGVPWKPSKGLNMRFEKWRGMPLSFTLSAALGLVLVLGWASSSRADGYRLHYTIPRLVPAYDYTTGGQYYAPPIPYGHYAKDHFSGANRLMG